jgi:predicted RNA-binding Zn-ribbon protein involved in translation (DUF1610 family)
MSRPAPAIDLDGPPTSKGVLFCPNCDHASLADCDWVVREHAASLEYRCPDCDARVTERGRGRERESSRRSNPVVRLWSTWLRTATAWFQSDRRRRV